MKMKNKRLLYTSSSIVGIIIILYIVEISTIHRPVICNDLSMYYNDSIKVTDVLDRFQGYSIVKSHSPNISVRNGFIYYEGNPLDSSFIDDMNQQLILSDSSGKSEKEVRIRIKCWIDDKYYLDEINPKYYGLVSRFYFFVRNTFNRRIHNNKKYECLLLTQNDTTYYTKDGFLCYMTPTNDGKICDFPIEDPMHNQMIKVGSLAFIRTEYSIYCSRDNLKSWSKIYEGKRSIKESLYFNEDDKSLIFSQYTPGRVRDRHYILSYSVEREKIDTLITFYTEEENLKQGLKPFCRHMHVLVEDPFTGDLYLGTGDGDREAGIYRSTDKGKSFSYVGGGNQTWRTLSFIFTDSCIYWDNDCATPQYICRINREDLDTLPIKDSQVCKYPLFNGACWCSSKFENMYILSSNSEGSLYDDNHRVYGIIIDKKGVPVCYSLIAEEFNSLSSNQLFIQGVDCRGILWFRDESGTRKFKLKKKIH